MDDYDVLGALTDEVLGDEDDLEGDDFDEPITPEDYEVLGYDDDGNEILGRRRYSRRRHYGRRYTSRRRRYRRPHFGHFAGRGQLISPVRVATKSPLLGTGITGVSGPSKKRMPLGMGTKTWDSTSTDVDFELTERPQVPIRPTRLIISQAKSSGASGLSVVITEITFGNKSQLAAGASLPIEMFAEDVMDSLMQLDSANVGLDVTIKGRISGIPAAGESVTIAAAFLCDAIS